MPNTPTASGPRRISIPDATSEIKPKALSIPDATPAPPARTPRAINPSETPTPSGPPARVPRPISPMVTPDVPANQRDNKPRTKTDLLIEKVVQIDPQVPVHRLRGRIDTILAMRPSDILDWGERNLAPLRDTSEKKAAIASEIARIDPIGWLQKSKDASSREPTFMERLKGTQPPSYYEGMLMKTRAELVVFVKTLEKMKDEFLREVTDLHLDGITMLACWDTFPDDAARASAQNRARTLMLAHQTAAMLQTTIKNSYARCMQSIEQIDQFMAVTLPNWKMASGNRP